MAESHTALEEEIFGKRILVTDHDDWPLAQVIDAYRSLGRPRSRRDRVVAVHWAGPCAILSRVVHDRLADSLTFLLDGIGDPTPGYLWVSDNEDTHQAHLMSLAHRILRGEASPDFADRKLLVAEAAALVAELAAREDTSSFLDTLVGELEKAAFGIRRIELLLDSGMGQKFLDGLLDAVRDSRVGCYLALTGSHGFERIKAEAPRLLGFCTVVLLDDDPPRSLNHRSLVLQERPADPSERGWTVIVRCRLTAPAPALAALAAGSEVLDAGGIGAFDDERVDNISLFATGSHPRAIMVSLSDDAAGPNDIELAGEIALDAARTAVWRSLREEEDLAVVRQVHH